MIETNRLFLHQPQASDKPKLIKLWQDAKVQKYLGGILSDEIAEERLSRIFQHWEKHNFGLWSVFEKSANILIGLSGLQFSEDGLELSYKFNAKYWGKGFASESSKVVLEYGFYNLNKNEIIAITQSQNERSRSLLGKIGMKYVREFRRYSSKQCLFSINSAPKILDYSTSYTKV